LTDANKAAKTQPMCGSKPTRLPQK